MVKSNLIQSRLTLEVGKTRTMEKQQEDDYPKHGVAPTNPETVD